MLWLFGGGGGTGDITPWVPGDGLKFKSFRHADLWKMPQYREAMQKLKDLPGGKDPAETGYGIPEEGIARETYVQYTVPHHWGIIETVAPFDEAKVREKLAIPRSRRTRARNTGSARRAVSTSSAVTCSSSPATTRA
jgi:hypothetical protein